MQKDEPRIHVPPWHRWEQHCSLPVHALPPVLQALLSALHTPFAHLPPQQAPSVVQASLSEMHVEPHTPPAQVRLWQSVATLQPLPGCTRPMPESLPVASSAITIGLA